MNARPLVSIVTATWNRADLLPATIESVLSQTYQPIEYIVVDDGSTDETAAVLSGYRDRVRAIRIEHGGDYGASALRRGWAEACGELVGFLDHDDLFLPEKIAQQVAALHDAPAAVAAHCGYHYADESGRLLEHTVGLPQGSYGDILQANVVWSGGPLIRRPALEKIGGYDSAWCGDWRTWLNLTRGGASMICVQKPLGVYRITASGMMSDVSSLAAASLAALDAEMSTGQPSHRMRSTAYGNMHFFLAGRCYANGDGVRGAQHLHRALGFLPALQRDPEALVARLVADATGPRTRSAPQYVDALLDQLPACAERLRGHEAQLRSGAAFGEACRRASTGDDAGAAQTLLRAVAMDPAWPRSIEWLEAALVDRAMHVSGCDAFSFVDRMIGALPKSVEQNQIRRHVHADLTLLRMLMMPWCSTQLRRSLAALAVRPRWLRNRGVFSGVIRALTEEPRFSMRLQE